MKEVKEKWFRKGKLRVAILTLGIVTILYLGFPFITTILAFGFGVNIYDYFPYIPEEKSHWIGITHEFYSYPFGTAVMGIYSIPKDTQLWHLTAVWTYRGKQVWLEKVEGENNEQKKTVSDAIVYPSGKKLADNTVCGRPQADDPSKLDIDTSIFGFVSNISDLPVDPSEVWRINTKEGKFESIPTTGIKCYSRKYEGFGG